MPSATNNEALKRVLCELPLVGVRALGGNGAPMYMLDFIMIGALKRAMGLGHGFLAMVESQNMLCSRALVRMQIDTVSRLLAYTYVTDADQVAGEVIGGKPLRKIKSRDGQFLVDAFLVDRLTDRYPWVRKVYELTSGEIHFSEKQFFSSISSTDEETGSIAMEVSPFDTKYPDESWAEVVDCFAQLCEILVETVDSYAQHKAALNASVVRSSRGAREDGAE